MQKTKKMTAFQPKKYVLPKNNSLKILKKEEIYEANDRVVSAIKTIMENHCEKENKTTNKLCLRTKLMNKR